MAATIKIVINSTESGGGIDKTTKDLKGMGDAAEKSVGGFTVMKGLAVNALTAVAGAVLSAAGAVAGFMKDALGAAADFEGGMNTFKSAAGDMGQQELDQFKDLFLSLGKELPVSTQAVQDAATAMVKGGIDPAIVRAGALKDTIQFGLVAGFETLEAAADTSAKLLGTWGDANATAAEQAAELAAMQEVLAKTASASTLEADKLSEAILMAGGSVKAAGGDYEEFVIVLGATANAFPNAATQGTSFNNFVTRLIPQTNTAKDAMAELGLYTEETGSAFYDANGQFIGFEQTAELMQTAFAGLTEAQRSEAMATIFGNDAKNAAIALYEKGGEGISAFAAEVAAANGIQGQAASTQQGLNFAMDNFGGSVEALQIVIGSALLPVLTAFVTQASTALNAAIGVAEAIFDAGAGSTEFYEALGPLNAALGLAPGTLGAVYDGAMLAWTGFQQVIGVATQLGQAFITWVTPYAQQLATTFQTQIVPAAMAVWSVFTTQIIPILMSLAPILQALIAGALTIFASFWTNILVPAISAVWGFITGSLLPILATLGAWLGENLPPLIQKVADFFANVFYPAASEIFGFITGSLLPALSNLGQLGFVLVANKVIELAGKLSTALQPAFAAVSGFITGTALPALDSLKPVMDKIAGVAGSVAGGFDGIAKAIGSAISAIKNFIEAAAKIKVPSLVTPGSPTPLELGFRGIGKGIQAATATMPAFEQGLQQTVAPVTNNFNYSPTYSSVPNQPSRDFSAMRSLAGAGV